MSEFSFKKGFGQVQQKDAEIVMNEIKTALNLKSKASWYFRLNGTIEPKVSEVQKIEEVFNKYGVTDIWGE